MELRISAGEYKNKKLKVPKSASPVRERIKLAVFSILDEKVKNAKCIDLCSGSGNLGLEALSRGAKSCVFVDDDFDAIASIAENIQKVTGITVKPNRSHELDHIRLFKSDLTRHVANDTEHYDIVFLDPPYDLPIKHALKYIHDLIKKDGIIVYFRSTDLDFNLEDTNQSLKISDSRKYGVTTVDFISVV